MAPAKWKRPANDVEHVRTSEPTWPIAEREKLPFVPPVIHKPKSRPDCPFAVQILDGTPLHSALFSATQLIPTSIMDLSPFPTIVRTRTIEDATPATPKIVATSNSSILG